MWPDTVTISTRTTAIGETSWTTEFQVVHTRATLMMVMAIVMMVSAGEQGARGCVCSRVLAAGLLRLQGGQEDPHPPGTQGPHQPLGGHQLLEEMASWLSANEWPSQLFLRVGVSCVRCGVRSDRRVCVEWFGARVLQTPIGTNLPFIGLAFLFRVSVRPRTKEVFGHHNLGGGDCLLPGFEADCCR